MQRVLAGDPSSVANGPPGLMARTARTWAHQPLGVAAALLLVVVVAFALVGPLLVTDDPNALGTEPLASPGSPSHVLGTDYYGRDMIARLMSGARVSLGISAVTVALSMTLALVIGIVSAYAGGIVDAVLQRLVDMFMALPGLILVLAIVAVLGFGVSQVVIALTVVIVPPASRVIRSAALIVSRMPYIESARTVGAHPVRIVILHLLPQVVAPALVLMTAALGQVILAEAAISFLGFGVAPPQASWGNMLSGPTLSSYRDAPWLVIEPGLALAITVFSVNVLGDALRDIFDPRLRQR